MNLPRDEDGQLSEWAWPGGYPIFYLDGDNSVLCVNCARKSDKDPDEHPGFKPASAAIHWEGEDLSCDECSKPIESAYGKPVEGK